MKSIHEQIAEIRLRADAQITALERKLFAPDPAGVLNPLNSVPPNDTNRPFVPIIFKRFGRESTKVVEAQDVATGEADEQCVGRTDQLTGKAASA